ncbi:MAG: STAS domain-containing protein [Pseudomonadota bacterium]
MLLNPKMQDGQLVVTVEGPRLDHKVAGEFQSAMEKIIATGATDIRLDLSRVEFMDAAGLGCVVKLNKLIGRAGTLELTGVTGKVDKVMRLTRMNRVFTIRDSTVGAV